MEVNKRTLSSKWHRLAVMYPAAATQHRESDCLRASSPAKLTLQPTNKLHSHVHTHNVKRVLSSLWQHERVRSLCLSATNCQWMRFLMDVFCANENRVTSFFPAFPVVSLCSCTLSFLLLCSHGQSQVVMFKLTLFHYFWEFMLPLRNTLLSNVTKQQKCTLFYVKNCRSAANKSVKRQLVKPGSDISTLSRRGRHTSYISL